MATYQDALAKYPDWAWAFNIPEVGDILRKGIDDPSKDVVAEIVQTKWYRTTQASIRQWDALKQTDPESANAQLRELQAQIWDQQLKMGLPADPAFTAQLAEKAKRFGWGAAQLQDQLGSSLEYSKSANGVGDISTIKEQIKANAKKYFNKISDETAWDYAKAVVSGEHTADDFTNVFREQAKNQFGYLAPILDSGVTMEDYFAPTKDRIAGLLEKNPADIDLTDPKYSKVLAVDDGKGGQRAMTFNESDTYIRSGDEWKKTANGQSAAVDLYDTLAKTFGKVAS